MYHNNPEIFSYRTDSQHIGYEYMNMQLWEYILYKGNMWACRQNTEDCE